MAYHRILNIVPSAVVYHPIHTSLNMLIPGSQSFPPHPQVSFCFILELFPTNPYWLLTTGLDAAHFLYLLSNLDVIALLRHC